MSRKHLTKELREILARLLAQDYTQRKIATILGCSQAAVSKEIKRNKSYKGKYNPSIAHNKATQRRQKVSRKPKKQTSKVIKYIAEKLESFWSPEQIAGRMRYEDMEQAVSFKTIYRWLARGQISQKKKVKKPLAYHSKYLRLKRAGKVFGRSAPPRCRSLPELPSIEQRGLCDDFGHWECDLVQGYARSGYLVSLVEKKTGLVLVGHSLKKANCLVNEAILNTFQKIAKKYIKSITYDRGKEFYGYKDVENVLKNKSYFCHPSCPHERGLNENTNGLLRQFFPKKIDFSTIAQEEIDRAVSLLNHRPRKKFNYKTTVEILREQGLSKVITFI